MSLPDPNPGLVIRYSYLWAEQQKAGATEGRKDRPCAIVVARKDQDGATIVMVVPITHTKPVTRSAIPVPAGIKRHLSLDDSPSWIVTDQVNKFVWPGYDVRPIPGSRPKRYAWGYLPTDLFAKVKRSIIDNMTDARLKMVDRD